MQAVNLCFYTAVFKVLGIQWELLHQMGGSGVGLRSSLVSWEMLLGTVSCTGSKAVGGAYLKTVSRLFSLFSFGIFMPKFKEHFRCGSGEIATVNAIQMGVTFASGTADQPRGTYCNTSSVVIKIQGKASA